MTERAKIRLAQVFGNAGLLLAVVATATPFLYMISASFKPGGELFSIPFEFLPDSFYLGNYELLFNETSFARWFTNSVFVATARTALAIVISLMAGFAFAKYDFPLKGPLFLFVIATLTIPIYVVLVPLYNMMITLGWVDSYIGLIVPFAAQAIGVFLARQYLMSLPSDLLEAARIDGASEWKIFWKIVFPLSKPVMAVLGILFFTTAWNDFVWPLILLTDDAKFTVSLGLPTLRGPYNSSYGAIMAGSFLGTLPILAAFLFMQRRFIEGITKGALKG